DIENLISRQTLAVVDEWWIKPDVESIGLHQPVVSDTETASQNEPAVEVMPDEPPRAPGKTELRAEVGLLRIVLASAGADLETGEHFGPAAQLDRRQFPILLMDCAEIFPAKASGDCQVRLHLVVVLEEEGDDVVPQILAEGGGDARDGIELGVFRDGSIVEEVPDVVESVAGAVRPEGCIHRKQAGKFA